ncbi:MAG: cytochrome C [Acidobacteria bacterium]|nr:MAG: cytochrome C [Acidobacteriota bacterium]
MRRRTKVVLAIVVLAAAAGTVGLVRTLRYGFRARDKPTRLEVFLAKTMRHYAVPADLRNKTNPLPSSQEVIAAGRAHFADHCAYCHANDGKGQTSIGQAMYPEVPDMTLRDTQSQSDGELFATIENGIRLTGMPAWGEGTADSAAGTWALVHFIRHLPQITPAELEEMKGLNPKTHEEMDAEMEERKFLEGGDASPRPTSPSPHGH